MNIKAKIPYLLAFFLCAVYMSYMLHGISYIDIIINAAVTLYVFSAPNSFFLFPVDGKYTLKTALIACGFIGTISTLGFITASCLGIVNLKPLQIARIILVMLIGYNILDYARHAE